jgi:signal transduction histidine kinase
MNYWSKSSLHPAVFQLFFITISIAIGAREQGMGLGLSMSYDMIRAHSIELNVATPTEERPGKEREGNVFIIIL